MDIRKSLILVAVLSMTATVAPAEEAGSRPLTQRGAEVVGQPVTPYVFEGDLRDLPLAPAWRPGDPIKEIPRRFRPPAVDAFAPPHDRGFGDDPLLEIQAAEPPAAGGANQNFFTPILNFTAQGYTGVNPPDTVGDVGTGHYIQAINSGAGTSVVIYDKTTGGVLSGPFTLDSLGAGNCANGLGDPIVLYDRLADRWLLSEFSSAGNRMCVYVSLTSDPVAGGWCNYDFTATNFPDYPKYAVWPDAYYVGTNENSPAAYAFDRDNMLTCSTARPAQRFTAPGLSGFGFEMVTPSDLDGATAPPAGSPAYFVRHKDDEVHSGSNFPTHDFIEIFEFDVDWNTPANSTFSGPFQVQISEFDSDLCGLVSFSCFDQPGGGADLDPLREIVMWRSQYRNFGTHEALIGNLVTDVDGSDHGGVRWYELRQSGGGGWTVFQEGTYAPDSADRWMGSVAMDIGGNMALGYNVVDETAAVFAGLRYVGREDTDTAGTMPQGEVSLVEGSAINGSNRYGDYAAMSVDPSDDCTFWFTGEYNPTSQWSTRIGKFAFDSCEICTPTPVADAGPDQVICVGDSVQIGTPGLPDHSYLWSPGGATTAQITVGPATTTAYTIEATTTCGTAIDSATVFVDQGGPAGLSEDFEGDVSDWTAAGLWHQADASLCADPAPSPVNAMYYGQDGACTYDTGVANSGSLTSALITGIDAGSTLTFDYWREVESFNGVFDVTEAQVVSNGGNTVTTVFSLDSSDASSATWLSSGAISLAAFAGQPIQVRFSFDTVDDVANNFTGWLIDNVEVTGSSTCEPAGGPTCDDLTSFRARCNASGTVQARVVLNTAVHNGDTITLELDGVPHELTIVNRRVSFSEPNAGVGQHTLEITDPAGCFPPRVVTCNP